MPRKLEQPIEEGRRCEGIKQSVREGMESERSGAEAVLSSEQIEVHATKSNRNAREIRLGLIKTKAGI